MTGYIVQLQIWPEDLKAIEDGTRFDVDEQGAILEPRRPIHMKKSSEFNLKDGQQRVDFFTSIAAIQLVGLQRHKRYAKIIAGICGEDY